MLFVAGLGIFGGLNIRTAPGDGPSDGPPPPVRVLAGPPSAGEAECMI